MLQGKWVRYILEKMESSPNFVLQCTAVYYEPFNTKKEINSFVALIWKIFIRFFFCFYLLINNLWILRTNHLTRCDKIVFYFLRIFSFSQAIFPFSIDNRSVLTNHFYSIIISTFKCAIASLFIIISLYLIARSFFLLACFCLTVSI